MENQIILHCICANTQLSEISGAEQIGDVVVHALLGFSPSSCRDSLCHGAGGLPDPSGRQGRRVGTGVGEEAGREMGPSRFEGSHHVCVVGLGGKRAPREEPVQSPDSETGHTTSPLLLKSMGFLLQSSLVYL